MARDLYASLGRPRNDTEVKLNGRGPDVPLSRDATQAEVSKAWVDAMFRHHPDRNPSDNGACEPGSASAKFRDARLASEVLGDPQRRALYDAGQWVDPEDPASSFPSDAPGWHKAVTDPARREVLTGFVEVACVLGGLDKDAAALASDLTIGTVASAVEFATSQEPIADRVVAGLTTAAKKFTHPEGRAALREAGQSAVTLWRRLFQ